MIHLFLDANVLLALYGLTPQEIAEFDKIAALVGAGELTIWLPEMVLDEYQRNRPKVVAEALKALRAARISVNIPSLSDGLPESDKLHTTLRDTQRAHSALLTLLEGSAATATLAADLAVRKLMDVAQSPPIEPVLSAARDRRELRRPPGKADSLGDAINWESLLANVPDGEDIHVVSSDPDFRSPLVQDRIHEYLEAEWGRTKSSSVVLYPDLRAFLDKHFRAIKVPSDIPKVRLIQRLAASGTFESTHAIVSKLLKYDVFTPEQAAMIARNAVRNNQVRWIATDEDVRELLTRVIDAHRASIDPTYVDLLERSLSGDEPAYSNPDLPPDD